MIVDCHTHLWNPEHISKTALKHLSTARGRWMAEILPSIQNASCERHYEAMKSVDKAIVFGWPGMIDVPNEFIAEYANSHPEKIIGFCSVNPRDPGATKELKLCVKELGLRGLKMYPMTQRIFPNDPKMYPICEAAQELEIPILWHLSTSFVRTAPLKYSQPLLLEDLALDFPDLKMIVAHLGFPKEIETLGLMRKQPNIYADIVGGPIVDPYRFYNAMVSAVNYGVVDKLLLGSDWPLSTIEDIIKGLKNINFYAENTNLPKIPNEVVRTIIEENAKKVLDL